MLKWKTLEERLAQRRVLSPVSTAALRTSYLKSKIGFRDWKVNVALKKSSFTGMKVMEEIWQIQE